MSTKELVKSCILFFVCIWILWFAGAQADEIRRVEVVEISLHPDLIVLEDEDGYIWTCPIGEHSWSIGEEYVLLLPDDGEPAIFEP